MGHRLIPPDAFNKNGYYESIPINELVVDFCIGQKSFREFRRELIHEVEGHGERCGFKLCGIGCGIAGLLLSIFENARFIFCTRNIHDSSVSRSKMAKARGEIKLKDIPLHTKRTVVTTQRRHDYLNMVMNRIDHIRLDFTERVSKEAVVYAIRSQWGDL